MGIRSPRLLGKSARRSVAVFVVALVFSPSALADNGASIGAGSTSVTATTTPNVTLDASTGLPIQAPPAPPARAVVIPAGMHVALSLPEEFVPSSPVLKNEVRSGPARRAVAPTRTLALSSTTRGDSSRPWNATPFGHSARLPASTIAGAATSSASELDSALPHWLNAKRHGAGSGSAAILLLLLFLAATLGGFYVPELRRKVEVALRLPRPHPYLLALERPD
jgi:hypothetical protein